MEKITTTDVTVTLNSETLERLVGAIISMRDIYAENKIPRVGDEIPDALLYDNSGWARSIKEQLNHHPAIICYGERGDSEKLAIYDEMLGYEEYCDVRLFVITPDTKNIEGAKAEAQTELEELAELGDMGDLGDDKSNLEFNLEADEEFAATVVERYTTLSDVDNNFARRMNLIHPLPDDIVEILTSEVALPTPAASLINMHDAPMKAIFIVDERCIIRYAYLPLYNLTYTPQQVLEDYIRLFPSHN